MIFRKSYCKIFFPLWRRFQESIERAKTACEASGLIVGDHFAVGNKVRQTIAELGGTMPENLPTPKVSAKKLKQERKKAIAEK